MIDFRSDTVTRPTEKMRRAMAEAIVGDDVLEEDPTIKSLEEYAAACVGKEAALFVPSGTFGNQLALFTHCQRGSEVVLTHQSHIVQHEAGAAAFIAGVQLRTYTPAHSHPTCGDIKPLIRSGDDIHCPPTSLVVLENALAIGELLPLAEMQNIRALCSKHRVAIHLDGARLFNAAIALEVAPEKIAACCDSVMFCLSKGLCAPVGSLLSGSRSFIDQARRKRKIMGGGMRQAGVLAAPGLVALKDHISLLPEDHLKAKLLAGFFRDTGQFEITPEPVGINMFFIRFKSEAGRGAEGRLVDVLNQAGILVYPPEDGWIRFVTHHDVSMEDVSQVGELLRSILDRVTPA